MPKLNPRLDQLTELVAEGQRNNGPLLHELRKMRDECELIGLGEPKVERLASIVRDLIYVVSARIGLSGK